METRCDVRHRRGSVELGAAVVLLVLTAWATAGMVSLVAAVVAAGVAFALVAHEVLDPEEDRRPVPGDQPLSGSPADAQISMVTCMTPSA